MLHVLVHSWLSVFLFLPCYHLFAITVPVYVCTHAVVKSSAFGCCGLSLFVVIHFCDSCERDPTGIPVTVPTRPGLARTPTRRAIPKSREFINADTRTRLPLSLFVRPNAFL